MDQNFSGMKWGRLMLTGLLVFQLAVLPVMQVRAAIPALAAVGLFLRTPIGKATLASITMHAAVLAIEFHNTASASPPADDSQKRLEVKLNPKDPMKTPSGWTPGSAANVEPAPPASTTAITTSSWSNEFGGGFATAEAAALDKCIRNGYPVVVLPLGNTGDPTSKTVSCLTAGGANSPGMGAVNYSTQVVCPSGYVVSGGACALANAAVVVKPADNMAEIKRVGNVFYTDARDTVDGLPPGVTVTPDKVTFVDSQGGKWETGINADGTTYTKESKARTDGSGKTDVSTTAFGSPDPTTGKVEVTGSSAQVFQGSGTLQSAAAEVGSGGDAKDSSLQQIRTEASSDRQAAETAAAALPAQLEGAKATGQHTVAGLGLPTQSQFMAPDVSGVGASLPSNAGDCVALDVTLPHMGLLSISPCSVVSAVRPMIDFLVVALGVLGGVFVLLGKREES